MPLSTRYAAPITTFRRQKEEDEEKRERERERPFIFWDCPTPLSPLHSTPRCSHHCGRVLLRPFSMPGGAERFFFLLLSFGGKGIELGRCQSVIECSGIVLCTVLWRDGGGSLKRGRNFLGKLFEFERCPLVSRFPVNRSLMLSETAVVGRLGPYNF